MSNETDVIATAAEAAIASPFAFDPTHPDTIRDPYAVFAKMRALDPVMWQDAGYWIATRYEDVRAVIMDRINFGQGDFIKNIQLYYGPDFDVLSHSSYRWLSEVFVYQDPPRHTRIRGLVTQEDIASALVPAKGMSVVGVSLPPALMPATQLQSGDQVRIVATPGAQGDVAAGTIPKSIQATVVAVRGAGDTGQIVVDVSVPYDQAAELAARAATGKVALVLDSRER